VAAVLGNKNLSPKKNKSRECERAREREGEYFSFEIFFLRQRKDNNFEWIDTMG
jgi:hypothetical protein